MTSPAAHLGEIPSFQTKKLKADASLHEQHYVGCGINDSGGIRLSIRRMVTDPNVLYRTSSTKHEKQGVPEKCVALKDCESGRLIRTRKGEMDARNCFVLTTGDVRSAKDPCVVKDNDVPSAASSPAHTQHTNRATGLRRLHSSAATRATSRTPSVVSPSAPKKRTLDSVDHGYHRLGGQSSRPSTQFGAATDHIELRPTTIARRSHLLQADDLLESKTRMPPHELGGQIDLLREYEETVAQRLLLEKRLLYSKEAHRKSLHELETLRERRRHALRRVSLTSQDMTNTSTTFAGYHTQEYGFSLVHHDRSSPPTPDCKNRTKLRPCSKERLQKVSACSHTKGQFAIDLAQRFANSLSLTGHRDLQASFCLFETHILQVLCTFGLPTDDTPGACEKIEFNWSDFGALLEEMGRHCMNQKMKEELSNTNNSYCGNETLLEAQLALQMAESMARNPMHLAKMVAIVFRKMRANVSTKRFTDDEDTYSLIVWLDAQVAQMASKVAEEEIAISGFLRHPLTDIIDGYPEYGRSLSRRPSAVFDKHGSTVIIRQIASVTRLRSFFLKRLEDEGLTATIQNTLRSLCLPKKKGEAPLLNHAHESGMKCDAFFKKESVVIKTLLENGYGGLADERKTNNGGFLYVENETIIQIQERLERLAIVLNNVDCARQVALLM